MIEILLFFLLLFSLLCAIILVSINIRERGETVQ